MFLSSGSPGSILLLDAVEAGHQHRGEGEVRVAGRVRRAELDALRLRAGSMYIGMRTAAERLRAE